MPRWAWPRHCALAHGDASRPNRLGRAVAVDGSGRHQPCRASLSQRVLARTRLARNFATLCPKTAPPPVVLLTKHRRPHHREPDVATGSRPVPPRCLLIRSPPIRTRQTPSPATGGRPMPRAHLTHSRGRSRTPQQHEISSAAAANSPPPMSGLPTSRPPAPSAPRPPCSENIPMTIRG